MFEQALPTDSYIELTRVVREHAKAIDLAVMDRIVRAIAMALEPWKTGRVDFYVNNHIEMGSVLTIEVELLPRWPFAYVVTGDDLVIADDPMHVAEHIAHAAYDWFWNRYCLEIPDNIILGSD